MRHKQTKKYSWKVWLIAGCFLAAVPLILARPVAYRYRVWKARQAIWNRDSEAALVWLRVAKQSFPEDGEICFLLARAHRHSGAYDKAIEWLKEADRLGYPTESLERERLLGMAESAQLAPDDARLPALLANPGGDTREIYEALVKGYYRLYEMGPASLVLKNWEEDYPGDPQPRFYRGLLSEHDENWEEAERWFRQALELASDRRDIQLHLARAEREQHRYRNALKRYRFCLQEKEDVEAFRGLGECLRARGEHDQAREAFLKGLAISPDDYDCLLALGELDLGFGQGQAALRWLEPAAEQKPREYDVRYALAKALLFSGQGGQARPHFEFVAQARVALSRVKVLRPYVASHPEDAERRYEIGVALLEYGDVPQGLRWLHSVFKYQPDHHAAHAALADFYSEQGDDAAAAEHRRLATGQDT